MKKIYYITVVFATLFLVAVGTALTFRVSMWKLI